MITESDGMKEYIDPILTTEITEAIQKLKNGKATGPDEIPNKIFTKAEPQTIEVYRKALQTIADSRDIPEQWQKGQIIRLYKGKGKRGKCSNERGITLTSNFGKLFERILNNRAKEKINITENQAGEQKGKATTDHLVVLKETIKEIRKQKNSIHGIPRCHKSVRQGMAGCHNVCDAQRMPKRPGRGPSKNNERKPNCTTEHQTRQHKGNKILKKYTPRGSAINPTIRTLERRNQ